VHPPGEGVGRGFLPRHAAGVDFALRIRALRGPMFTAMKRSGNQLTPVGTICIQLQGLFVLHHRSSCVTGVTSDGPGQEAPSTVVQVLGEQEVMAARTAKLLILSDIHGNWPALEAVLAAESECDAVVFCGDVVDYGPQPVECLRWVMQNATYAVRGNHDNAIGFGVDCRCMGAFREYSIATRDWHRALLSDQDRAFLRQMPVLEWFKWRGKHFRVAHATPQGNLFEYLNMDQWGERLAGLESDFVLLGHTHLQGMRTFGEVAVVNPGSVGLARDFCGEACYAVFEEEQILLRRIPYDVEQTAAALRAAPLQRHVIDGLTAVLGAAGSSGCP